MPCRAHPLRRGIPEQPKSVDRQGNSYGRRRAGAQDRRADLQHATVFYTVFGTDDERAATAKALESAKGKIRSSLGQLGIRLTPSVDFVADALPEGAAHLEDLLVATKARDEEIAKASAGAAYAGEADPYRKPSDADVESDEGPEGDGA